MIKVFCAIFLLNLTVATAQTRVRPNSPPPASGKVYLDLDFAAVPFTVEDLIQQSSLIVDGSVISVLPAIRLDPANTSMIQTDSLVAVTSVLAGSMPTGVGTIAVSQFGGKIGDLEAIFPEDHLMTVGERYIFFLYRDKGKSPSTGGFTRYYPAGGWIGKAKVANGVVSFPANAHGAGLTGSNGAAVTSFLTEVQRRISLLAQPK